MTGSAGKSDKVLGSLGSAEGKGVVRMEDRFDTDIDDLWSALTEPARLARWLGRVEGDLRLGGQFHGHFFASGWEGTGRVAACEPPQRFHMLTTEAGEQEEHAIEAWLTAEGDQTVLVIEERGMPLDQRAAYGAGLQVHLEDLAAHLVDQDRCDARARWAELLPAYQDLVTPDHSSDSDAG
jgi:uncharacterized protein YndB with AHSA1/START domain